MHGTCPWPDIAELFSPRVRTWLGAPHGEWERLWPQEQAVVAGAVSARRAAFSAGRLAAHNLLAEFGFDNHPLGSDDQRVPCWPAGVLGSITHSDSLCVVAVAPSCQVFALGVDTEPDTPLESELWPLICGPAERDWLEALPADQRGRWAKLLFCIKESVYKAWFVRTRQTLGFADVAVQVECAAAAYRARVLIESPAWPPELELRGRFAIGCGQMVVGTEVEEHG